MNADAARLVLGIVLALIVVYALATVLFIAGGGRVS